MNNLSIIEYQNKRVLTTSQLAETYETESKNIYDNFSNNKERFIEGRDYCLLQGEELRFFKRDYDNIGFAPNLNKLYLWTERGANRHSKILDTDMAWKQFDYLEETYFQIKQNIPQLSKEVQAIFALDNRTVKLETQLNDLQDNMPLFNIECDELQALVRKVGMKCLGGKDSPAYKDRSLRGKVYADIQSILKREFGVERYKAIKRNQIEIAKEIVTNYQLPFILKSEIAEINNTERAGVA